MNDSLLSVLYVPSGWRETCPAGCSWKRLVPLYQVRTAAGLAPLAEHSKLTTSPASTAASAPPIFTACGRSDTSN